jgi:all-trans-8'-apo-beta-carotenal 15,15'-oxygenase
MALIDTYLEATKLVEKEYENEELPVVAGSFPEELSGYLFRNGTGRMVHHGVPYQHPFDGDGMVSRFHLTGGKVYYSNRYVRTREFLEEEKAGKMLYRSFGTNLPGGFARNFMRMRFKNAANTSVVWHGGRLLALWEGGLPHLIHPGTLQTQSRFDYDGILQNQFSWFDQMINPELPFSAHPKIHSGTGELYNFGVLAGKKQRLVTYRVAPDGKAYSPGTYELPDLTFVHDFVLTEGKKQIYFITPVAFDIVKTFAGLKSPVDSITGRKDQQTLIWVLDGKIQKSYEAGYCFVFHYANGYEAGNDTLLIDAMRLDDFPNMAEIGQPAKGDSVVAGATLTRYTIDMQTGKVQEASLSHFQMELPSINPGYSGRPYRYVWAMGTDPAHRRTLLHEIIKVDCQARQTQAIDFYPHIPGEPLMVPRPGGTEDEGWLLVLLFDIHQQKTRLMVLDSRTLEVTAEAALPHALPLGFHGTWVEKL